MQLASSNLSAGSAAFVRIYTPPSLVSSLASVSRPEVLITAVPDNRVYFFPAAGTLGIVSFLFQRHGNLITNYPSNSTKYTLGLILFNSIFTFLIVIGSAWAPMFCMSPSSPTRSQGAVLTPFPSPHLTYTHLSAL